jgi:carbon-monoxide dehydrogenase small subunit
VRIHCTVNGAPRDIEVDPLERTLDVLRRTGLTGTKEGCGEGECGSCTILLNGVPVNSCLVIASQMDGAEIVTIEGLASSGILTTLQQAFIERGATQCGICTPGILMAAEYLVRQVRGGDRDRADRRFDLPSILEWAGSSPGDDRSDSRGALEAAVEREVRACLAGNICRCTGYEAIVRAVKDALREAATTGR